MRFRHPNIWLYCGLFFIFLAQTHTISWQIICLTSNARIAESFANQRMILTGLNGNSQQINLDWEKGRFKFNVTDIFNTTTKDVGLLTNITMWNDNTKPGPIWVTANITFVNLNDGSIYRTSQDKMYVNSSKMVYLVENIFRPTTQKPELSTFLQETLVSFSTGYSTETEIITLLDTSTEVTIPSTSTELTIPSTSINYQETSDNNISTDTINSITTDVTINTSTDDITQIITTNAPINMTITTTTSSNTTSSRTTMTTGAIYNSTNATITSSTSAPMCLCPCIKKLTKKEQLEQLKEIKKELTIEKKKTSRYIRKKISIPDDRVSAKVTGYIGIILLICPFAAILAADLSKLVAFMMAKYLSKV